MELFIYKYTYCPNDRGKAAAKLTIDYRGCDFWVWILCENATPYIHNLNKNCGLSY